MDAEEARREPSRRAGRWVQLGVGDTGPGLAPEVQAHLFEPFFTTKEVGKGTGLGLATVHGLVGQAGGHIHVESEPGRGTTFRVCLPRVDEAAAAAPPPLAAPARGGTETILLIEDDPQVRLVAERALAGAGYDVLVAAGGAEALARVAGLAPGALHLVVADVIMPGLDGRAVVEALRLRQGPLRALFVSGHPGDVLGDGGVVDQHLAFLPKPFTGEQLRARVRALLDEA